MPVNTRSWLILIRSTPYGSHLPRAAIDVALTAAAFEQEVACVFLDEGVLQLQPEQDTTADGQKNIGRMVPALKLYDVEAIYHHAGSAAKFGLSPDLLVDSRPIEDDALQALVARSDQVMVF